MENVPNMISTKDLSYIKDMFEWNFNANKTASHFKEEVQTEEIKEMINKVSTMHKEHCMKLINILK